MWSCTSRVTVEVPSIGLVHLIIAAGNEASKKALPIRAGLNQLWPRPPNTCLLESSPQFTYGCHPPNNVGGRLKAKRNPVTIALPSYMVMGLPSTSENPLGYDASSYSDYH